jgi:hypothetical protein
MNNDDLLISKLLEETCVDNPDETEGRDLVFYFEKRSNLFEHASLSDYVNQLDLSFFSIKYEPQIRCYRMQFKGYTLDFPENWSVFHGMPFEELIYVTAEEDHDHLCSIFDELNAGCSAFVLVNDEKNYGLVLFNDTSSKEHLDWFKNYFEKKKLKSHTQAA